MKRLFALLLAALIVLSCAACDGDNTNDTGFIIDIEAANRVYEVPADLAVEPVENPVTYFSMNIGDADTYKALIVYQNEDGTCTVDYSGEERKVVKFSGDAFHSITDAMDKAGVAALNGRNEAGNGETFASMFIQFSDDNFIAADFFGDIPQEFTDAYNAMYDFFVKLTAEAPVYVPVPSIMGEVSDSDLAVMLDILGRSEIEYLDSLTISSVANDEFMGMTIGLSDTAHVTGATSCSPMMMTTAYSLVVVNLDDDKYISDVCDDFADGIEWNKWVCVSASKAVIARKDNMVLCLLADGDLYEQTLTGINAAGWKVVQTLENPDM